MPPRLERVKIISPPGPTGSPKRILKNWAGVTLGIFRDLWECISARLKPERMTAHLLRAPQDRPPRERARCRSQWLCSAFSPLLGLGATVGGIFVEIGVLALAQDLRQLDGMHLVVERCASERSSA